MQNPNSFPDFKALSDDLYKQWESAMTNWWDQVLESPAVLEASGKQMSQMTAMRARYEEQVDAQLHRMHLPTRSDLTRLARIASLLEKRLLEMEDNVLEMKDTLEAQRAAMARMEKETIQARIEAAEARLEMRTRLEELQARLDAQESESEGSEIRKPAPRKPKA